MSWSASAEVKASTLHETLAGALGTSFQTQSEATAEAQVAFEAAIEVALDLATVVAKPGYDGLIGVHVSGHANPDNEPRSGYASDTVQVTVYQVNEK